MVNRMESNTEDMNVISTMRTNSIREDKKKQEVAIKGGKEGYCKKCCREIKLSNISDVPDSKQPMFSPVLQVKDYLINNSR